MLLRTFQVVSIFLLILLVSCRSNEAGNQVVVQIPSEPKTLHPIEGYDASRLQVLYLTHQSLTTLDPYTLEHMPLLARDLPNISEDRLTYSYEVHPDANWGDGAPITVDDVLFSLKAAMSPLLNQVAGRSQFSHINGVSLYKGNNKRFNLQMKDRTSDNRYIMDAVHILDKRIFDPEGMLDHIRVAFLADSPDVVAQDSLMIQWAQTFTDPKYGREPDFLRGGSAPYEVQEWVPNQRVVLKKRKYYWGQKLEHPIHSAHPDRIVFKVIPDENAIELQVKQEKIDVAINIPTRVFDRLQENEAVQSQYKLMSGMRDVYSYIGFNLRPDGITHKPILADTAVRRALGMIAPIDELIDEYQSGRAKRIVSPVSPASKYYNTEIQPLPYLPDSAAHMLQAAGWIDTDGDEVRDKEVNGERIPLRIVLILPAGQQSFIDMMQRIVDEAAKVGMDIVLDPIDFNLLITKMTQHDFDAFFAASSSPPVGFDFAQNWTTDSWQVGTNFTGYGSAETDRLIEKLRYTYDTKTRKMLMWQIQEMIHEAQPVLFLYNSTNDMVIHQRFENAEILPILPYVLLQNLEMKSGF